ncbi:MFS transporter [Gordonia alkaliphila]|uniref:MFS transporter n=1 Tax=Gordonia alkaliphila TaxID=1053547 RepID=UPI001FF32767|nr:MFS transporter [Gordonia alkaliphila]MCK0439766.1 MFS transporter [Gordonia alkaliphila]
MRARVGRGWLLLFTLAWLTIWMVQLTPLQLLLPLQLDDQLSAGGDHWVRGVVFSGLILGIGGIAGVIAGPLAGALSDRTGGRRRRPWAVGGSLLTAVCLVLTGFAHTPLLVGAAWIGVSVGVAVASAAYTALIADQLPADQRGAASAAVGSSQAAGIVVGVGVVVTLGLTVLAGYLFLAVLIAVVGAGAALLLPDPVSERQSRAAQREHDALRSLRDPDFAWMLVGRFVANVGNALGTSLFLFFLLYGLHQEKTAAEDNLLLLVVVYTVFVVIASVAGGLYSDRTGRRRSPTVVAAMVQALSGLVICLHPTFTTTLVGAALMGIGYGIFSTTGLAFATDLLPHEEDHGRDLGVVNVAASLGQLIGPMLGAGLVAAVGGFWLLFAMAAVLSVLGGLLTLRAREKTVIVETPVT